MTWIIGLIKIVILLGTLITIHELGHFLMARLFKVKVLKFAIGFGPKIFTKTTDQTEYTIRLIPFGGFVQMEGEDKHSDDVNSFGNKPIWQRILVVAAGPLVNIVFAVLIYFVLCSSQNIYQSTVISPLSSMDVAYEYGFRSGDEILKVNQKKTNFGWNVTEEIENAKSDEFVFEIKRNQEMITLNAVISPTRKGQLGVAFSQDKIVKGIVEDMPVSESGLMIDDKIIASDGVNVPDTEAIVEYMRSHPNADVELLVLRNNQEEIYIQTQTKSVENRDLEFPFTMITPGFWKGIRYAIAETNWYLGANLKAYITLFTGRAENVEVMGVVGIADEITKTSAWIEFFSLMCAISLSLGIFNLLPIPALDGGRILLLLIELIRRKPLSEKVEQSVILVSFIVIFSFAIVVTVFDISKLFMR